MKILVTGASGFLGRSVLRPLAERGHEVIAVSQKGETVGISPKIKWVRCNLLSHLETKSIIDELRPEGLLHLAWETSHGVYWNSPNNLLWTGSSLNMLEAFSRNGGKRLIIAGSSA